jgi:hypothetical protein
MKEHCQKMAHVRTKKLLNEATLSEDGSCSDKEALE